MLSMIDLLVQKTFLNKHLSYEPVLVIIIKIMQCGHRAEGRFVFKGVNGNTLLSVRTLALIFCNQVSISDLLFSVYLTAATPGLQHD